MKITQSKRRRALTIGIVLIFTLALFASGAYAATATRVFVQYRPGNRAAADAELFKAGAKIHYHFADLNSFVVSIPNLALRGLRRSPHIAAIEEDPLRTPVRTMRTTISAPQDISSQQTVPYGVDMVQARQIWDANLDGKVDRKAPTGAGRTVCIIDTGFWQNHEDFQGIDVLGGFSQTDVDPSQWTFDGVGHGTHVAGTIVAANNDVGVVGVTPGAVSLYLVKIFGDDGLWVSKAHASDLIDAAYRCADNGANVISMSLSGTQKSGKEEKAFNNLYTAGVLSVAAASNEGIEEFHYPASYNSVISVSAIDEHYQVADFSQFNTQVELAAPGVAVLSSVPFYELNQLTVDGEVFNGYHVENSPYGLANGPLVDGGRCLSSGDWDGAIVLCERGDISFYDKVINVQNSKGAAAIIYNNQPGNFFGTLGDGNSSLIAAITLSQEDGRYLVANKIGKIADLRTSITWHVSGYQAWDGTSMATPHVAAAAALIWSWKPELTNAQIRAALQATAMDLGAPGRDVYYGYGLVQAYDAWTYLGGGKPGKPPK